MCKGNCPPTFQSAAKEGDCSISPPSSRILLALRWLSPSSAFLTPEENSALSCCQRRRVAAETEPPIYLDPGLYVDVDLAKRLVRRVHNPKIPPSILCKELDNPRRSVRKVRWCNPEVVGFIELPGPGAISHIYQTIYCFLMCCICLFCLLGARLPADIDQQEACELVHYRFVCKFCKLVSPIGIVRVKKLFVAAGFTIGSIIEIAAIAKFFSLMGTGEEPSDPDEDADSFDEKPREEYTTDAKGHS